MDDHDLAQSLEELEGDVWGARPDYDSHLVREAHRLRSVPLRDLTVEDLRLLLGQQIGTRWLMPLALARLAEDPLAEGDNYPGDLLAAVLRTDAPYWSDHPDQLLALFEVRGSLQLVRDATDRLLAEQGWPPFG